MKKHLILLLSILLTFTMTFGSVGMVYAEGEEPGTGSEVTEPVSIESAAVTLEKTVFKYNGTAQEPSVKVILEDGSELDASKYTVIYENNTEAGTASVKVTANADSGYTGTCQASFVILGSIEAPKLVSKTTTALDITWNKYTAGPADGYKVYRYNKETGENTLMETVSNIETASCTLNGLDPGTGYRLRVAVYKNDPATGQDVIGAKSSYKLISTDKISFKKAAVVLEYRAVAYDGYYKYPEVKSITLKDGTVLTENDYTLSYSNNKKLGWGKVKITPKEDSIYKDEITASFYIVGKLAAPTAKKRGTNSITLTWDKHPGTKVEGYKLYRQNSKGKFVCIKTIQGVKNTTYTQNGLASKKAYKYKIAAYTTDSATGKTVIGKLSSYRTIKTLPKKPDRQEISLKLSKPYIKVKWNKLSTKKATSFEIMYSTSSTFSNASTVTVKNDGDVSSYLLKGLSNNTRYYVKVRAVNSYGGYTAYGKWSYYKSLIASTSGWCTIDGRKYYYSNGSPLKGNQIINGEHYYFDGKTGECHGVSSVTWSKVKNVENSHPYLVTVCILKHRINIFKKIDGDWVMTNQWSCTTGINDEVTEAQQYTPRGNYQVRYRVKTFGDTYSVWYATNFHGPFYIHSILYDHGSMSIVQDGRLGISASHGCVRTSLSHAKWIYDNVEKGSALISSRD